MSNNLSRNYIDKRPVLYSKLPFSYLFQFGGYDLSTSVSTSCVFLRLRQRLPIRIYDLKMTDKMER